MSLWTWRPPMWVKVGALVIELGLIVATIRSNRDVFQKPSPTHAVDRVPALTFTSETPERPTSLAVADPSAHCRDGTVSYSKHRSGTCAHHGGVLRWVVH